MATSNKFLKSFDTLADFLRMLSYGCYPRNDATLFHMSRRTYDDYLQLTRFFLPEKHLEETKVGGNIHVHFQGDAYHQSFNFLSRAYGVHAVTGEAVSDYLRILQCFHTLSEEDIQKTDGAGGNGVQIADALYMNQLAHRTSIEGREIYTWIWQEETELRKKRLENDIKRRFSPPEVDRVVCMLKEGTRALSIQDLQTLMKRNPVSPDRTMLNRRIGALLEYGFLSRVKDGKVYRYSLKANPLAGLSAEEAAELLPALFFCNVRALLTLPGCRISTWLARRFSLPLPGRFLIKNNNFTRILDDETMLTLLASRNHGRGAVPVSFDYRGKRHEIYPTGVSTDFLYQREYVTGRDENGLHEYRVDQMKKVSLEKPAALRGKSRQRERSRVVVFLIHCPDPSGIPALIRDVEDKFPGVSIRQEDLLLRCRLELQDPLKILPSLRTFYPFVEILPSGAHHLVQKEKNSLEEALKNYDQSF